MAKYCINNKQYMRYTKNINKITVSKFHSLRNMKQIFCDSSATRDVARVRASAMQCLLGLKNPNLVALRCKDQILRLHSVSIYCHILSTILHFKNKLSHISMKCIYCLLGEKVMTCFMVHFQ